MNRDEKNKLTDILKQRVRNGESKTTIYREYSEQLKAEIVARLLATIPTPICLKQSRRLNWILVAILIIGAIFRLLITINIALTQPFKVTILVAILGLFNLFIIWLVATYSIEGYLLLFAYAIYSLEAPAKDPVAFIGVVVIAFLSWIILKRLLPQTTLFMKPKRDAAGVPQFEN